MKSLAIRDPQGRHWMVSVRMLPWGLKWRGPRSRNRRRAGSDQEIRKPRWYDGLDIPDFTWIDDGFGSFVAVLLVIVAIGIGFLFVLPAFIFLVEVLIVLVVMLGAVLVRVLFRQPWIVDATSDDGTRKAWKVIGYRNSRRVVEEIGSLISKGTTSATVHDAVLVR